MMVNFGVDGGVIKISLEIHVKNIKIVSLMRGQLIFKLPIHPNSE